MDVVLWLAAQQQFVLENLICIQGLVEELNLSLGTSDPQQEFVSGTVLVSLMLTHY